ncbi:hypothetical protein [Desertivirga xinjiangensis]|uniref:hypothetical protein n=1 Tax=Desertivirga xinjiangensis TaxID=539206 RepID=UPI00210C831D|nr:hypothetical protein [Pedobacter xinjiangensis]
MAGAKDILEEFFKAFPQAQTGELSLEELNELMAKFQHKLNDKPEPDFDGLSPTQMHLLLNMPFSKGCPIIIPFSLSDDLLQQCPILVLSDLLLSEIRKAGKVKLTSKGNLPVALCQLLYDQKVIEYKYMDLIKKVIEENIPYITPLKLFLQTGGYIKKRNNQLSITKKGEAFLNGPATDRFKSLLLFFAREINWMVFAPYHEAPTGQNGWAYTLYLLRKYGDKPQPGTFYSDMLMRAFDNDLWQHRGDKNYAAAIEEFHWAFQYRFFEIFATWFGFTHVTDSEKVSYFTEYWTLKSSPLCRALFRI